MNGVGREGGSAVGVYIIIVKKYFRAHSLWFIPIDEAKGMNADCAYTVYMHLGRLGAPINYRGRRKKGEKGNTSVLCSVVQRCT